MGRSTEQVLQALLRAKAKFQLYILHSAFNSPSDSHARVSSLSPSLPHSHSSPPSSISHILPHPLALLLTPHMLKFVKEGALDILALTLPSSLLESIRQISEEDLLPQPQVSHKQRQPRARTQKQAQEALHRRRQGEGLQTQYSLPQGGDESKNGNVQRKRRSSNGNKGRRRRRSTTAAAGLDLQQQQQSHTGSSANSSMNDVDVLTYGSQQGSTAVYNNDTQQLLLNDIHSQQRSLERSLNELSFDHLGANGGEQKARLPTLPTDEDDHAGSDLDDSDYDSIDVESEYDYSDDDDCDVRCGVQQLPYEVLAHVFGFLPASDLMSTLSVCRQWRQIALLETRQVDISECFPQDCLGLDQQEEYSDFEFVVHLFSTFPFVSTIVIRERYLRDRDLRVVTAGILAGKMAFTHWNPHFAEMERQYQLHLHASSSLTLPSQDQQQQQQESQEGQEHHLGMEEHTAAATTSTTHPRIIPKIMRGSIKEELSRFSKSVARYVLVPQTRNTLRKKILAQLQVNLEQKHQQGYWWMVQEGFQPERRPPVDGATITDKHALVPITHYRFQDCCFANDWGANMDLNKLPMIGLAAAISHLGLFVDLDGSYGAPSKSVKTMLGFCFGPNCVISLAFGFRHTHMELEHVTEMISENSILHKMDIVDAPAYQDLIFLPALRGLGRLQTEMQRCCLELDELGLQSLIQEAATVFQCLSSDLRLAEETMETEGMEQKDLRRSVGQPSSSSVMSSSSTQASSLRSNSGVAKSFVNPIVTLAEQLAFPLTAKLKDKHRTAKVLLQGVVSEGLKGLLSTRDKTTGQALLHTLAWRRHYSSTMAQLGSAEFAAVNSRRREGRRKRAHPSKNSATRSTSMDSIFSFGQQQQQHRPLAPAHGDDQQPVLQQSHPATVEAVAANESSGFLSSTPPSFASLRAALPAALTSFPLTFRRRSLPLVWFGSSPPRSIGFGDDDSDSDSSDGDAGQEEDDENEEEERRQGHEEEEHGCGAGHNGEHYDQNAHDDEGDEDDEDEGMASDVAGLLSGNSWSLEERRQLARLDADHPIVVALRMAKILLGKGADPNVYNNDGRTAAMCASFMGFQPMETLLVRHGGVLKELQRIRETM